MLDGYRMSLRLRPAAALIALSSFVWVAAAPASAEAQRRRRAEWEPKAMGHRVGLDVDIWSTSPATITAWTVFVQARLPADVHLDFEVPWAYGSFEVPTLGTTRTERQGQATFGNPTFGAHWAHMLGDAAGFHVGGSFSIATLYSPAFTPALTAAAAALVRAGYDMHRNVPQAFAPRIFAGIEACPVSWLILRTELVPTFLVPTEGNADAAVVLAQGNEVEARTESGAGVGMRMQEAFFLSGDLGRGDRVQTAAEAFVGYEPMRDPSGWETFARVGLLVALDPELGWGFDDGKLRTVKLEVGGKF